jgi:hypothetical protein
MVKMQVVGPAAFHADSDWHDVVIVGPVALLAVALALVAVFSGLAYDAAVVLP